jgi:probable HAF family extracellular repeat protein
MPVYTYTTLDDPSAGGVDPRTEPDGINASGQIVGRFRNSTGFHGFLLSGGTYTTLDAPGANANSGTTAGAINAAGQIVGAYTDSTNTQHAFLLSGGIYTTLANPSRVPM